jgi:hypothetical protein
MRQLFEIKFYKNAYENTPEAVCAPDLNSFSKTLQTFTNKVAKNEIPSIFEKVCKTTMGLRYAIKNGPVVCIGFKDDISKDEIEEYNRSISSKETSESKEKSDKPKIYKNPERIHTGRRGRPALSPEEKAKRATLKAAVKERSHGKRGRPPLSPEEKARRLEAKMALKTQEQQPKRGRGRPRLTEEEKLGRWAEKVIAATRTKNRCLWKK